MRDRMPRSTALTTVPTSPGGPDLALGERSESELPVAFGASKSFGSLIRSYGRGKGLSIAAPCNNMPGQKLFWPSSHRVSTRDHLGSHWGVNRGSFKAPRAPYDAVGGGHRA